MKLHAVSYFHFYDVFLLFKSIFYLFSLDKPTRPLGPLKVEAVYKDRCHLTWIAPKDDGGLPILYYQVEAMDVKAGKWMKVGEVCSFPGMIISEIKAIICYDWHFKFYR